MLSQEIEEVLETLYLVENEHKQYPCDEATVSTLEAAAAAAAGLVEAEGDRYRLTASGQQAGRKVVRRHRLAERLLHDVVSAGFQHLHEDACRFEHDLKRGLDERICILLGHPTTCPHGRPIPQGECCRKAQTDLIREVGPLSDGRPGAKGKIAYLATRDNREIQKLMAMGVLPGESLDLIRRFPSYVFQVGFSQFTVDRPLAEVIYVHWAIDDSNEADQAKVKPR